jgi:hypothetical protein
MCICVYVTILAQVFLTCVFNLLRLLCRTRCCINMGDTGMQDLADLATTYSAYTDPATMKLWVTLPDGSCSFDRAAVQMALAIHKVVTCRSLHVDCYHSRSMPNGALWETPGAIGLHIDDWNFRPMTEAMATNLEQKLFSYHEATTLIPGFVTAMTGARNIQWAVMHTIKGKYHGMAARCTECDATCRVAWGVRTKSSAHHMSVQRRQLCQFLNLPLPAIVPQAPLPIV